MTTSLAICYDRFGPPLQVLYEKEISPRPLKEGEVRLKLLMASINPSDFGMIEGTYGRLKEAFPTVAGREGVGEVVELGGGVTAVKEGDWVAIPDTSGVWQDYSIAQAEGLMQFPKDLPLEKLATSLINPPTALRLLSGFADLKPGDWVIQNAGNSAVGQCVVALCKELGYKSISVVRDLSSEKMLKERGADHVVQGGSGYHKDIEALTGGGAVRLALNSVGGESAIHLVRSLSPGGTHVTFGGMTGEPVRFPTRSLIFSDVSLRGFWLDQWLRSADREKVAEMYDIVFTLIRSGVFNVCVDRVSPLKDTLEVLARLVAGHGGRGKILLRGTH